ncbi:glycosyltransferase [Rhodococcus sp. 7Tela_A2]|jgi:UDP-N-acetylglucosamine--N-acetylmuramyl-(pentapeptide) pyrophosphoryl-undecaprenol N-acetylglucosamine transferase|uniref:glycosyltransferase n=1 Tax=Rhodococcus sp. 7Tela_A2 TaxID=3093744 RepID=UPI003BB69224
MIGYYIHHHGHGHLARATSICAHLRNPVTALSSATLPGRNAAVFDEVVELPRDDEAVDAAVDPTAHGLLHWVPRHDDGLRRRMAALAEWIARARPRVMVVDVSVEVTLLARLFGIPVVVMAMPGTRTDAPHTLGYRSADHLIAAWPQEVYDPEWLHPYAHKTSYVGGISRFDGRRAPPDTDDSDDRPTVLVMGGSGGSALSSGDFRSWTSRHTRYRWEGMGVPGGVWADDPWPSLCRADVVIGHAGQNTVADIAAARRPAVLVAERRPYDEQHATTAALHRAGLSVGLPEWPDPDRWPELIERARGADPAQWARWQTSGAAARAAAIVDRIAEEEAPT